MIQWPEKQTSRRIRETLTKNVNVHTRIVRELWRRSYTRSHLHSSLLAMAACACCAYSGVAVSCEAGAPRRHTKGLMLTGELVGTLGNRLHSRELGVPKRGPPNEHLAPRQSCRNRCQSHGPSNLLQACAPSGALMHANDLRSPRRVARGKHQVIAFAGKV